MLKAELIAAIAHGINAAYCASIGDDSQTTWDAAPDWQKQSAIAGVNMHLANPNATPEQSHESWMAQKLAEGWQYGEEKNADAKTHPCLLPYAELPQEQQSKDYLFRATVHLVNGIAGGVVASLQEQLTKLQAELAAKPQEGGKGVVGSIGVAVKYIGVRPDWEDNLYSTGLYFTQGQTRIVPTRVASLLARHADMFEVGQKVQAQGESQSIDDDTQALLDDAETKAIEQEQRENTHFDVIAEVGKMTKEGVIEYAMQHFNVKLDARSKVDNLRGELTKLIEQYGVL